MEINGILTASNYPRSREFYRKLLPFPDMIPVMAEEETKRQRF